MVIKELDFKWVMSNIVLFNDDCFNILEKLPKMDLVVADPPYSFNAKKIKIGSGGTVNNIKKFDVSLAQLNDKNLINSYDIVTFGNILLKIQDEVNVYFWCNKNQIPEYLDFYVNKHKCKFDILCWHKPNALPTYANKYLTDTEYLLYFHSGSGKCFPKDYEDAKTYHLLPINHKDKKLYNHPTIKPLEITMKIIRNSSKEGQNVLDPFMGSGTTGVACKKLNRNFYGIEIASDYFEMAKNRIDEKRRLF